MLRRIWMSMLLAPLVAGAAVAAPVAWHGWNEGLAAAAGGTKPVIVDVYTDWCGWCKRMDRDTYSRPEIGDYLNKHFVMVRLNAEGPEKLSYAGQSLTARALAGGFQVTGYPTTIFLKPDGTHLVNVPGYIPADQFLKLVRFIGDGHMDKGESWEEYSRTSGAGAK
jgi:thioredoxin-related protein